MTNEILLGSNEDKVREILHLTVVVRVYMKNRNKRDINIIIPSNLNKNEAIEKYLPLLSDSKNINRVDILEEFYK